MKNYSYGILMSLYVGSDREEFITTMASLDDLDLLDIIVVVLDGFVPFEPESIIRTFYRGKISIIALGENQGLGFALSHGVRNFPADICIRIDTDDIYKPKYLQKVCDAFEGENVDIVSAHIEEFQKTGETTRVIIGERRLSKPTSYSVLRRNPLNHMVTSFRVTSALNAGNYVDMPYFEDWYLWIRMLRSGSRVKLIENICCSAQVGTAFYKRRTGLDYIKKEIRFYLKVIRGEKNTMMKLYALFFLILRILLRCLGSIVYKFKVIRK